MPELKLTFDSDDDMDIDLAGNHDTADMSGIPELTEDIVVDQDVADPKEQYEQGPIGGGTGGPSEAAF